jgi:hypothetical protein
MIAAVSEEIVRAEVAAAEIRGAFRAGFRLVKIEYPEVWIEADSITRERTFNLRFQVANYDGDPPQVRVVYADGSDVRLSDHPLRRNNALFPPHPASGLDQFLCIDGTRDYYLYSGHDPQSTGIGWEQQREVRPLSALILEISRRFETGDWE